MNRFVFKLEPLYDYRQRLEEASQREFGEALVLLETEELDEDEELDWDEDDEELLEDELLELEELLDDFEEELEEELLEELDDLALVSASSWW